MQEVFTMICLLEQNHILCGIVVVDDVEGFPQQQEQLRVSSPLKKFFIFFEGVAACCRRGYNIIHLQLMLIHYRKKMILSRQASPWWNDGSAGTFQHFFNCDACMYHALK